jgi:hypothetical protein
MKALSMHMVVTGKVGGCRERDRPESLLAFGKRIKDGRESHI